MINNRLLRRALIVHPEAAPEALEHAAVRAIRDLFAAVPSGGVIVPQSLRLQVHGEPEGYRVEGDLLVDMNEVPAEIIATALADAARKDPR